MKKRPELAHLGKKDTDYCEARDKRIQKTDLSTNSRLWEGF